MVGLGNVPVLVTANVVVAYFTERFKFTHPKCSILAKGDMDPFLLFL